MQKKLKETKKILEKAKDNKDRMQRENEIISQFITYLDVRLRLVQKLAGVTNPQQASF